MYDDEHDTFRKYISPPNPIISKPIQELPPPVLTTIIPQRQITQPQPKPSIIQPSSQSQYSEIEGDPTLLNSYSEKNILYRRYINDEYCVRNNKKYLSSIFTRDVNKLPPEPSHPNHAQLKFNSKLQSGNLYAVYKTSQNMYDLIITNDINTSGYTQWYYFTVTNTKKNQTVQFNIVNFYKSTSLYNVGMKPLVNSLRSERGWKRSGFSVYYDTNDMKMQGNHKKYYRSLTFSYNFQYDDDEVSFAHCYPYTYHDLKRKIHLLQESNKLRVKNIGLTPLQKNIPMIHISVDNNKSHKKAIIILARQHPGETVGSYLVDQIMTDLIKNNTQKEFLLWRFDFYIFPMVNIDGVILGNYRGNAFGYDLNRCWQKQSYYYQPQVYYIKSQIKKILKKQPIQLILDLHGHSRKLNSFFYGNPFGHNYMLFPYIASKLNPNISFNDSTFGQQSDKSSTARVVLGNSLKQVGSVYTYEVSFYGGYKNSKKVHFSPQDYKQLSRTLISSMYKTFIEDYKEEKTLKQSIFFKQLRKEIKDFSDTIKNNHQSCSDDQAEVITRKQLKIKNKQNKSSFSKYLDESNTQDKQSIKYNKNNSVEIQVNQMHFNQQIDLYNAQLPKCRKLLYSLKHAPLKRFQEISSPQKYIQQNYKSQINLQNTNSNSDLAQLDRKQFLMNKLRIFGQTFVQAPIKLKNKDNKIIQTNQTSMMTVQQQQKIISPTRNIYRKKKTKNNSLIIKINQQPKSISDIVKINKIDYQRIKRNSNSYMKEKQSLVEKHLLPLI